MQLLGVRRVADLGMHHVSVASSREAFWANGDVAD